MIKKDIYWHEDCNRHDGCTEYKDNLKLWHLDGLRHREDGPAEINPYGVECWYLYGKKHREDGPAWFNPNNRSECWWLNGKRHRENGPAWIHADGTEDWYLNGERIDRPSLEYDWKKEGF